MLRLMLHRTAPRRVLLVGCSQLRAFSLPAHEVVGMPAMSPTMEVGTIVSWAKAEGELVSAGETIAEIETDKATINFDAVDDAYVAKVLVEPGTEVAVGVPILVTVEDEEDVAAFSNFSVSDSDSTSSSVPPSTTPEPTVSAPTPTPPPTPPAAPVKQAPSVPTPAPVAPVVAPRAPPTPSAPAPPVTSGFLWGSLIKKSSPIATKIAKDQQAYVEKFGNSSHSPLEC